MKYQIRKVEEVTKDAVPIDKLDEFYKKWSIGEPFVRNYKA